MGLLMIAQECEEGPPPKMTEITYPTMMKLGTVIL